MIFCCGEALIDMIPEPTKAGADGFVPHVGGAVFNTAMALGRLGAPTGLLTGLSEDLFGRRLRAALEESGVDASRAVRSRRPTTLAFVTLADGQATYDFYDENSAGRMLRPADMPPLGPEVGALFFGGVSLAAEPCADAYEALLTRERAGRAVMLDPNIRPDFIADEARFRARLGRMMARADIVKISREDLDWLEPDGASLAERAARIRALGPAIVVATAGADGARAFFGDGEEVSVAAPKVEVVDTVGAGDAFNAGVLASLWEAGLLSPAAIRGIGADALRAALSFAATVASLTVTRRGASPPWRRELPAGMRGA